MDGVAYNSAETFELGEVSLSTGPVRYLTGGEGPALLYLHGAGGLRVTPAHHAIARGHCRVYLPIMPGFDQTPLHDEVNSMAELAQLHAEFIDRVIGGTTDVAGFAFGARIALWLGILGPECVGQLVVHSPSGVRPPGELRPTSNDPAIMRRQMFAHPEREPPVERSPAMIVRNRDVSHTYHTPGKGVRRSVSRDEALVARVSEITALTLLLHGTRDETIGAASVRFLKSRIRRAFLIYIYDAAHGIEIDQPERYVELVTDFLVRGEAFLVNPGNSARS